MEPRSLPASAGGRSISRTERLTADELTALFRARLPHLFNGGCLLEAVEAQVLKASRFKPVIAYWLSYRDMASIEAGPAVLIGKGYHRGTSGLPTFDAMRALWADGLGSDRALTIAAPVAYFDDIDLMLQGHVAGRTLYEYITGPPPALDYLPLVGRWLAKLHAVTEPVPAVVERVDPWVRIRPRLDELVATRPDFATRLLAIGLSVERGLAEDGHLTPVPLHGDFQPKNIILSDGCVSVIDFDHFTYGEPARDAGYLVAQNLTMSYSKNGSFAPVERWNQAFLDGYVAARGEAGLQRLPLFVVMAFLHILHYKLCVLPVRDASFVPAWLAECERLLAQPYNGFRA